VGGSVARTGQLIHTFFYYIRNFSDLVPSLDSRMFAKRLVLLHFSTCRLC
jgi:hypothetical protein